MDSQPGRDGAFGSLADPLAQTVGANTPTRVRLSTTNLQHRKNGNVCCRGETDPKAMEAQGQDAKVTGVETCTNSV